MWEFSRSLASVAKATMIVMEFTYGLKAVPFNGLNRHPEVEMYPTQAKNGLNGPPSILRAAFFARGSIGTFSAARVPDAMPGQQREIEACRKQNRFLSRAGAGFSVQSSMGAFGNHSRIGA